MGVKTNLFLHVLLLVICLTRAQKEHPVSKNDNQSEEARLLNDLLSRRDTIGQRMARPVHNVNDSLLVHYGLSLIQILDVDEINQNIVVNVWETHSWVDVLLSWKPADYDGIRRLTLPIDMIWKPDFVLYQNVQKDTKGQAADKVVVFSDGRVLWVPSSIYKSTCPAIMDNFPFDTQRCNFKFGSWSYSTTELKMDFFEDLSAIDMSQYMKNVEWEILENSAQLNEVEYSCCPNETFSDITYTLVIERHWKFYFMFLLLPAIILSCMSLMIFWIPPGRPDRTGLGSSIIGSFMLLLILITYVSPPGEDIRFAKYISSNMVLLGFSTLFSCLMVNLSLRTDPMATGTRKILVEMLGSILGVQPRAPKTISNPPAKTAKENGAIEVAIHPTEGHSPSPNPMADWKCAVSVLDRLMFMFYLVVVAILLALYFPRP